MKTKRIRVAAPWVFTMKCACGQDMRPRLTEVDECCMSAKYKCVTCGKTARSLWPCVSCYTALRKILWPKKQRRFGDYDGWQRHPIGFLGRRRRFLAGAAQSYDTPQTGTDSR